MIKEFPESWTRTRCKLEIVRIGSNCKLPRDIQNFPELKHFRHYRRSTGDIMPKGLEKLIYLETLDSYMVRKEAAQACSGSISYRSGIEELAALNNLRELRISDLENVGGKEDAERAKLKDKQHMEELYLYWSWERKDGYAVLEGLQPHPNLRKLIIDGFLGHELPTWIAGTCPSNCLLQNLVELELVDVDIDEKLPALGMLPSLENLLIAYGMKSTKYLGVCDCNQLQEEEESSISTPPLFQSLWYLTVSHMDYLEDLIAHSAPYNVTCKSFPSLQMLDIEVCRRLRSIPLCSSLEMLKVEDCRRLRSIPLLSTLQALELKYTNPTVTSLLLSPDNGCLESLTCITIEYSKNLKYLPPLRVLLQIYTPKLESLDIKKCKKFRGFRVDDDLNRLSVEKREDLNSLCSSFSLRSLEFHGCPMLKYLPDLRSWTSLKKLEIWKCRKLKESLTYELESLTFLESLKVDFIEREQGGDPVDSCNLVNLIK